MREGRIKISRNSIYQESPDIIPGKGISLGITIGAVSLLVLIPMISLVWQSLGFTIESFWNLATEKRMLSSYGVSLICSLQAAFINSFFGLILAWVLVRYEFPGKGWLNGLIELPFALPTAVAGIALTYLYSEKGWLGAYLSNWGIKVSYTKIGITIAMVFIGIPFVVRCVQPVLEKLDHQYEEAGTMLGAKKVKIFWKIVFPELLPSLLTGFGLAFARALGEYGSVVFIAGNIPYKTEIAPLMIMSKLERYDYSGATAAALVMLIISFLLLFLINGIQVYFSRFHAE